MDPSVVGAVCVDLLLKGAEPLHVPIPNRSDVETVLTESNWWAASIAAMSLTWTGRT